MTTAQEQAAFERAAKYICTLKCGLCPMAVEKFPCPFECTEELSPWRCWQEFFRQQRPAENRAESSAEGRR